MHPSHVRMQVPLNTTYTVHGSTESTLSLSSWPSCCIQAPTRVASTALSMLQFAQAQSISFVGADPAFVLAGGATVLSAMDQVLTLLC